MAIVTGIFNGNVRDVFSCGCKSIMAIFATAEHLTVVEPGQWPPRSFQMAVLALIGGLYMVQRWRCRFHQAATAVATGAFPGRAVKHATYVA